VRALIALLSKEILGVAMMLPEFPVLKGIRGMGMSDDPKLAERLAEKFDYTNTFYHQAPFFDVTNPPEKDEGRYDFILSSEIMEHVPAPVEKSFAALARMLKPEGVLVMTTPYNVDGKTVEHFPELHQYSLASLGGHIVLVNRRRDGAVEVFENLNFHGGPGSTLELRVFTEGSLRETLAGSGFPEVRMVTDAYPEFGIEHSEMWSLPMAARKGPHRPPHAELAEQYRDALRTALRYEGDIRELESDYRKYAEFHEKFHTEVNAEIAKLHGELQARTDWGRRLDERIAELEGEIRRRDESLKEMEQELEERTKWAVGLRDEKNEAIQAFEHEQKMAEEARTGVVALRRELEEARTARARMAGRAWTRVGRKLGVVD
jgi:SAM-dependent methyltransferase